MSITWSKIMLSHLSVKAHFVSTSMKLVETDVYVLASHYTHISTYLFYSRTSNFK